MAKIMKNVLTRVFKSIFCKCRKVKIYGWKGVVDYVVPGLRVSFQKRHLCANAKKYKLVPGRGITVIADFSLKTSLMKTMRDLVIALKDSGIPYQTFNLGSENELTKIPDLYTPKREFKLLRYSHVIEMHESLVPDGLPLVRLVVHFWEFDSGFLETFPNIQRNVCWLAMSDFNAEYFRTIAPYKVKTKKLLYPFRFISYALDDPALVRSRYGLLQSDFVVFYNFALGTAFPRKNPEALIVAFARAFSGRQNAKLLLKLSYVQANPDQYEVIRRIVSDAGVDSRVIILDKWLSDKEIINVTNASDVYCSLHRGEGFGLGVGEAMSLGKPVVVADWSATTEFAKPDNAFLVPVSMVRPIPNDDYGENFAFGYVRRWAEPNVDCAVNALSMLYCSTELRERIGMNAKAFMEKAFSREKFRESVNNLLNDNDL